MTDRPTLTRAQRFELALCAFLVVAAIAAGCAFFMSCASLAPSQAIQKSPEELARLSYVDSSLAYDVTMSAIEDYSKKIRPLSAAQKKRTDDIQETVRKWAPKVRTALDMWRATGLKPATFDEARKELADAHADAESIKAEVIQ